MLPNESGGRRNLVLAIGLGGTRPTSIRMLRELLAAHAPSSLTHPSQTPTHRHQISPLGPLRVILVPPGASSILEATVDSYLWGTKINTTPSGKTLLTASLPDKSFELHLDVNIATMATLGKSPKTGGPVVKILDSADAALITLLPAKSKSEQFEDLLTKYGSKIKLDT